MGNLIKPEEQYYFDDKTLKLIKEDCYNKDQHPFSIKHVTFKLNFTIQNAPVLQISVHFAKVDRNAQERSGGCAINTIRTWNYYYDIEIVQKYC
jgi:hypothetical protein